MSISVSVDGNNVWSEGIGLADVENNLPCTPATCMRIASLSKPITMALVAKLYQDGLLDLDKPVEDIVPEWPVKFYNGKKAHITTRKLVSMNAGVRDYDKCYENKENKPGNAPKSREMYTNSPHSKVTQSLEMFKNDDLCNVPGTAFLYSNHSWTLISAVVEVAAKKKFPSLMKALFHDLGMQNTHLDRNSHIIQNRSRYYELDKSGSLMNSPAVDLSFKWAAGGVMSTPEDLCIFGSILLACYQGCEGATLKGDHLRALVGEDQLTSSVTQPFLSQASMKMVWNRVVKAPSPGWIDCFYAMGWCSSEKKPVIPSKRSVKRKQRQYFYHTGNAIGASSGLAVMAREEESVDENSHPRGTVVAITTNLYRVALGEEAIEIANLFEDAHDAQEAQEAL